MSSSDNISPRGSDDPPPLRLVRDDGTELPAPTPTHERDRLLHELSNLLDGSLRNVGLALSRFDEATADAGINDDARQCLATADRSLHQMAGLLRQWMRSSCADLGSVYRPDAKLGEIVEHAVRNMAPVARVQEIDLHVDLSHEATNFPAGQLYPVIANGLRNAVESIGTNGAVTLEAEVVGEELEVRIVDDGAGVADDLPRDGDGLVAPGVSTKTHGQGLGLAISRDIVRAMGGVIRLEPNEPRGAVLLIRLPKRNRS